MPEVLVTLEIPDAQRPYIKTRIPYETDLPREVFVDEVTMAVEELIDAALGQQEAAGLGS
jgi:hypothetical protein